jgi:hypothetical protein
MTMLPTGHLLPLCELLPDHTEWQEAPHASQGWRARVELMLMARTGALQGLGLARELR